MFMLAAVAVFVIQIVGKHRSYDEHDEQHCGDDDLHVFFLQKICF